jgi:4-aminobutyrate aminotransferase
VELVSHREKLLSPIFSQDWPNLPTVRAEGVNTGHNHPKVVAAAREQMEKQIHGAVGVTLHESVLRLTETLPEILPGALDMFFFGNSGSEGR